MTDRLVRMPDQFRPARDTPIAATPTCCCCCCCCLATMITASVVLPMRVEIMAHAPDGTMIAADRVRSSKLIAGFAPFLSFAIGVGAGFAVKEIGPFGIGFPLILLLLLGVAFGPFGRGTTSIPTTLVFFVAFAVEFVVGLFGILATAGIGYLAFGIIGSWLVIRQNLQAVQRVRGGPQNFFGPEQWEPRPNTPPPLPRPPSSDE